MDPTFPSYVGFADGVSRWSPNLASATWVIYSPSHELIHIDGICVGIATNNQVEYNGVAGLLTIALHLGIHHLDVFLDPQLNDCYRVHDHYLFRKFLRTRHLVRHFESMWYGPYVIHRCLEKGAYILPNSDGCLLKNPCNGLCLKRFYA